MILRTVAELPGVTTWVAMVQKEVGERFAAAPGSSAYGVPSVLAQLACDVKVLRPVSRRVFHPVPNVDSVLLGLTRRGPAPEPALRALVQQAFAHRRKALAGSLALAPDAPPGIRDRARAALTAIGRPPDARAEQLSPPEWRALYRELAGEPAGARAAGAAPGALRREAALPGARQGQPVPVRRPAAARRLPPARVAHPADLAGGRADARAGGRARRRGRVPRVEGENLAARALAAYRAAGWRSGRRCA